MQYKRYASIIEHESLKAEIYCAPRGPILQNIGKLVEKQLGEIPRRKTCRK